jgi:hypothetical protein
MSAASDGASATSPALAPIDHAIPLTLDPGDALVIRGALRTSFDGTVLDATTHTVAGVSVAGGLYDTAGGGLVLVAADPKAHEARFARGGDAPACHALGIAPPCLVPRIAELSHERLLTASELTATLEGSMELSVVPGPPHVPPVGMAILVLVVLTALAAIGAAIREARRRSPLGHVRIAAAEARRATRGDAMLEPVAAQIDALVQRAAQLETARHACAKRLTKIDRAEIARRSAHWAVSTAPEAVEALAWAHAEQAEARRLEADFAASVVGLDRIASALRVITLHARSHRGVRVRTSDARTADPVDTVATELALRDEAIAEAERAT